MTELLTPEEIENSTSAANAHTAALTNMSNVGGAMQGIFAELGNKINGVAYALSNTEGMSTRALAGFSALSVGVLGVRDSFEKGFDIAPLNTFSGQLTSILEVMGRQGNKDVGTLTNLFTSAFGTVIPDSVSKTVTGIETFLLQTAKSADNALRLQNALFKMGAVTGDLNKVLSDAGGEFENMNDLLMRHQKMITDTAAASGTSTAVIEEYWAALGQIPKALESQVTSARDSGKQVSMLDATMQYAAGSGRDFMSVIADLKDAHIKMGVEGEAALKFTARMGELANNNNVEFSVMHDALSKASDDIKNFGGEGMRTGEVMEGVVKIMNNYLGALKETGVSGATAVGMIQTMTNSMLGLDVAQRAFLSQQAGGAGGLRGAFQIEQMIREGKGAEVMAEMQKSIEQMTGGRMVSVEEAAGSEEAANRAVMQRQMIMSGPLGKLAGDEQGAARIAEMFAAKSAGTVTGEELAADVLQKPMEDGLKFQETSATHLGVIRSLMEGARGVANITALGFNQTTSAARVGTAAYRAEDAGGIIASEEENRQNLTRFRETAGHRGGDMAGNIAAIGTSEESTVPVMRQATAALGEDLGLLIQGLGPALRAPIERVKNLIAAGDQEAIAVEREKIEAHVSATRERYKNQENSVEKLAALDEAARQEQALALATQLAVRTERLKSEEAMQNVVPKEYVPNAAITNEYSASGASINANFNPANTKTAGQNVGAAATHAAASGSPEADENAPGKAGKETREPIEVDVKVTGICIDCGRKMAQNPHTIPGAQ